LRGRANKPTDIWDRVVRTENGCWLYTGTIQNNGYGCFMLDGKKHSAHVVAYAVSNNVSVPLDHNVLHECNNKRCCNPAHLFKGTVGQNARHAHLSGAVFGFARNEVIGVSRDAKGYWKAYAYRHGRQIHLYAGGDESAAIVARKVWEAANPLPFGAMT
jgi:hypothetical protein